MFSSICFMMKATSVLEMLLPTFFLLSVLFGVSFSNGIIPLLYTKMI